MEPFLHWFEDINLIHTNLLEKRISEIEDGNFYLFLSINIVANIEPLLSWKTISFVISENNIFKVWQPLFCNQYEEGKYLVFNCKN